MGIINAAGTYTKSSKGFKGLEATSKGRAFNINGTIGTRLLIQHVDEAGTANTLEDGEITTLPASPVVRFNDDIQLVSEGSPSNLSVTITLVD